MPIALFKRLPRMGRSRPEQDVPMIDPTSGGPISAEEAAARWPAFTTELRELDEVLVPRYQECSVAAAVEQNRHRRQQVLLILGGLLTSTFGAVQAALAHSLWPGIVVAGVAAATSAVASVGRQSGALDAYLANRLRAERLRSAYFAYLMEPASESAAEAQDRLRVLRHNVVAIRYVEGVVVAP